MKTDKITFKGLNRPMYVLEENRLRENLSLISDIAKKADIDIILSFKAYALWKTFPIFREYVNGISASSLCEARLGHDYFGVPAHTFSTAYTDYEIDEIAKNSSTLVFNSLSQFDRLHDRAKKANGSLTFGLRVNPEYSEVGTALYNPCSPGSRFGILADDLPEQLPSGITGFHCHCHCESGSDVFERTLKHIEAKFSRWFPLLKWINFGGGHLMTRKDYDVDRLIKLMRDFHQRYPWLRVILEPGSAFGWQTGCLVSQVQDIVTNHDIRTAILNVSFTCHMPDCLEMPYYPAVRGAKWVEENDQSKMLEHVYRLGGNSCLSGDFMASWVFDHELEIGENVVFEDMLHYTTVKTTLFNGVTHPAIALLHPDGELEVLRQFGFEDYVSRMD